MSKTPHEIVLLGANMGGVPLLHYLFRHTIPRLNAIDQIHDYHVTIVSPNDSYYWKIAAPRVLIDEKQIPVEKTIYPIADLFKQYSSLYQHIPGKATAVNPATRTVSVSLSDGTERNITYNSLIIATGVHYDVPLFTTEYGTEALKASISTIHASLPKAQNIVVAGGGPVGVETSAELATFYPKASITLYSGTSRLLERNVHDGISAVAERQLKALRVNIVHKLRVVNAPTKLDGPVELTFDDGSKKSADLFLNAFSSRRNTGFLPESWIEKNGAVRADKDSLRVVGADNVYVIGDANANSNGQSTWAGDGIRPLASALAIDALKHLNDREKTAAIKASSPKKSQGFPAWLFSWFGFGGKKTSGVGLLQQEFKTQEGVIIVPIGKGGTGLLMGWRAPGFLVQMAKGKDYLLSFIPPLIYGDAMAKE